MLKFFSKQMNNKKGFTLIELIVVIAILAILALIAIPRIGKFRTNAAISSHNANVRTLESAATMYLAEEGLPKVELTWDGGDETGDDTEWTGYLAAWPTLPKGLAGQIYLDSDGEEEEIDGEEDYTVSITVDQDDDDNGVIVTVTPGLIKTDDTDD